MPDSLSLGRALDRAAERAAVERARRDGRYYLRAPLDDELAVRFRTLHAGQSEEGEAVRRQFLSSFMGLIGRRPQSRLLSAVAPHFRHVDDPSAPIRHPALGHDRPYPECPDMNAALGKVLLWTLRHTGGEWAAMEGQDALAGPRANIPLWFQYALLEACRRFYEALPDHCDRTKRAREFLTCHPDLFAASAYATAHRFRPERVSVDIAETWTRRPGEDRNDFVERILGDLAPMVLEPMIAQGAETDAFVETHGQPHPCDTKVQHARVVECANRVLGRTHPTAGTDRVQQERLLSTLGFLIAT